MKLLTQELINTLPPIRGQEDRGMEAIAYARLFTPDSDWAWYITEFDGQDTLFGLVTGFERELGYFSLSELEAVRGPLGLPIERDLAFTPTPLRTIMG
jgi:hypothetical protein